jgi:fatty acid desaturase
MNDPNTVIPESSKPAWWRGYENWQVRRHEKFLRRYGHRLPRLRNRRSARRLVIALAVTVALVFASAIATFFTAWAALPFLVIILGAMLPLIYILRTVTLNVSDAPASALDEFELASRNAARSIAYTALWISMFIPYIVLLILAGGGDHTVDGQVIQGSAVLLIVLVAGATCIPTCLIGWWLPDPDPEDFATYPEVATSDYVIEPGGFDQ